MTNKEKLKDYIEASKKECRDLFNAWLLELRDKKEIQLQDIHLYECDYVGDDMHIYCEMNDDFEYVFKKRDVAEYYQKYCICMTAIEDILAFVLDAFDYDGDISDYYAQSSRAERRHELFKSSLNDALYHENPCGVLNTIWDMVDDVFFTEEKEHECVF